MECNKSFSPRETFTNMLGTGGDGVPQGYYQEFPDGSRKVINFNAPQQPNFNTEEMRGSMQQILSENIGNYVVVEFLIGTEMIVRKQGILYAVGLSYMTLYDDSARNFIVCDIFSVKFVYFYFPGDRPRGNFNILSSNNGTQMRR